jgi:ribosomal protein S18 acetylase RimI-like enzyme
MDAQIRPMREPDLPAIVALSLAAWEPVFHSFEQILGPTMFRLQYPDWRAGQQKVVETICLNREKHTTVVAEVGGAVAGFLAYELNAEEEHIGEVSLLAVHPDYQNRGIGTALNMFALERMKEAGMRLAVVGTGGDPGHAPARRSYEKAGYTALPLVRYYKDL